MVRRCSVVELLSIRIEARFEPVPLGFVGAVVEPWRSCLGLASLTTLVEVVAGDWLRQRYQEWTLFFSSKLSSLVLVVTLVALEWLVSSQLWQ